MSEARPKPIIVIHPSVCTPALKKEVRRAGYIVVAGEPENFKVLDMLPIASLDLITKAALRACIDGRETDRFGRNVATALLAESQS